MNHELAEAGASIVQLFTTFEQEWGVLWLNGKLSPETLTRVNPDYQKFTPVPQINPLLYATPAASEGLPYPGKIVVAVMGPSSSGKDTVLHNVDWPFAWIKTTTTRPLRPGDPMEDAYVFASGEEFAASKKTDKFIETLPQASGNYGTTIAETVAALDSEAQIVVWRGEINGLPKIRDWIRAHYPQIPFRTVFILPQMTMYELVGNIIRKRGMKDAFKGRITKAFAEVRTAGSFADFLLHNPPQAEGPTLATAALGDLFRYLTQDQGSQ